MKGRFFCIFLMDMFCVVSGVIGAGFATGQEILLYFFGKNPFFVATACFAFFALFFFVGLTFDSHIFANSFALKKTKSKLFDIGFFCRAFLHFCSFVVLSAMLSGAQTNADIVLGGNMIFPVWGIVTALVCVLLCGSLINGIKRASIVLGPIMIFFIVFVCFFNNNFVYHGQVNGSIAASLFYVSLNTLPMVGLLTEVGKNYPNRLRVFFAVCSALLLSIIIFFVLSLINAEGGELMPLVNAATKNALLGKVYGVVVMSSIVTTVCTASFTLVDALNKYLKNGFLSALSVIAVAFVFSLAGFKNIVSFCYPMISAGGILISLVFVVAYFKNRSKNSFCRHK